jgi:hypothetical protein
MRVTKEMQFNRLLGLVLNGTALGPLQSENFEKLYSELMGLIEEVSAEDGFGTEGWQHHIGWD